MEGTHKDKERGPPAAQVESSTTGMPNIGKGETSVPPPLVASFVRIMSGDGHSFVVPVEAVSMSDLL